MVDELNGFVGDEELAARKHRSAPIGH